MSNARIQFSSADDSKWTSINPKLREGELVFSKTPLGKYKAVVGAPGGSNYKDSILLWDEAAAEKLTADAQSAAATATQKATEATQQAEAATAVGETATTKAAEAANSANSAADSASAASGYASTAAAQATAAANSANAAASSESNAAASAAAAVQKATAAATSAETAAAKATAAADSASAANDSAITAGRQATAAANSASAANNYAANAKNYSENVNVFLPTVSDSGVLSWTNKAGLANPASVNIKGAKGDKGDTGNAATIEVGTVTTGAAGSSASVTNSGTASNVVLNFTLPRGKDGKDGGITVDAELSDTSTNPIQNKAVKTGMDTLFESVMDRLAIVSDNIPTKVSTLENDAGYLTQHQSLDGYAKTSVANTWTAQQNFHDLMLSREKYTTSVVNGTSYTPTTSTIFCTATGAFTLNLATLAGALSASQSSVFTAYFAANADYSLTITNAGTLKYVGSASDVAITSAGLLLNIMMLKDASGNLTSIVQASKLS